MSDVVLSAELAAKIQEAARTVCWTKQVIERLTHPQYLAAITPILLDKALVGPSKYPPTWQTICGRDHLDFEGDLLEALKTKGVTYEWAKRLLTDINYCKPLAPNAHYELVKISGRKLGFSGHLPRRFFHARGEQLGLDLCPPEIVPHIYLQRQRDIGWAHVASAPYLARPCTYLYFQLRGDKKLSSTQESDNSDEAKRALIEETLISSDLDWIFCRS